MADSSSTLWGIIALALIGYLLHKLSSQKARRMLPPGPKPVPILGNINDFPPDGMAEYQHWIKHKDLYGGLSFVAVLGMTFVIVHDKKAAHELLDRIASKTSGRPTMIMANKLCGYGSTLACRGYDPGFRRSRKYLHQMIGTKTSSAKFRHFQEIEVKRQLIRALSEPEKWLDYYKTTAAATVLSMAYGYTIEPHKPDALVGLVEKMMVGFSLATVPMSWAVDIFPPLQYLPEKFPGATFQKTARKWRNLIQSAAYVPYRFVRRQMATHNHRQSYISGLVEALKQDENGKISSEDEEAIVWSAVSLYGAASDTTAITLTAFTLAMIKFEHVQRKAQEEIDRVVGTDRLPAFEDRENLPYIDALVKEATRWWPVVPMGFPHTVTEDLEFNGFFIPKGASVIPSIWWFLHDPEVYADPESFDPDRFLPPRNEPDPYTEVFGYGRRICPGRFFADSSLYLNMAQTLAAFNITKAVGKDGKEIGVDHVMPKPGILTHLTEFKFQVKPRSEKHADLIRQAEQQHPWEASDAGLLDSVEDIEV
ncbi:hypothetical protein MFIFM68171_06248 [Madurella fahalii]|uniref:O-methylsterigmatocystin oxidoreductase n=1 Tax=Madurella fahalii TaxID=1157608 RepID=A0ABQ0GE42_9PEZI